MSDEKPREFWIKGEHAYFIWPANIGKTVHVIEKSAYDSLAAEIERYKKALDLAMYYVEGDSTYEALKSKIENILNGITE